MQELPELALHRRVAPMAVCDDAVEDAPGTVGEVGRGSLVPGHEVVEGDRLGVLRVSSGRVRVLNRDPASDRDAHHERGRVLDVPTPTNEVKTRFAASWSPWPGPPRPEPP